MMSKWNRFYNLPHDLRPFHLDLSCDTWVFKNLCTFVNFRSQHIPWGTSILPAGFHFLTARNCQFSTVNKCWMHSLYSLDTYKMLLLRRYRSLLGLQCSKTFFNLESLEVIWSGRLFQDSKKSYMTLFFNKQLNFGPALKSCLAYLVFQSSQNDWYTPLKPHILALFSLSNVVDKFARIYSIKKAISPKIVTKSQP